MLISTFLWICKYPNYKKKTIRVLWNAKLFPGLLKTNYWHRKDSRYCRSPISGCLCKVTVSSGVISPKSIKFCTSRHISRFCYAFVFFKMCLYLWYFSEDIGISSTQRKYLRHTYQSALQSNISYIVSFHLYKKIPIQYTEKLSMKNKSHWWKWIVSMHNSTGLGNLQTCMRFRSAIQCLQPCISDKNQYGPAQHMWISTHESLQIQFERKSILIKHYNKSNKFLKSALIFPGSLEQMLCFIKLPLGLG